MCTQMSQATAMYCSFIASRQRKKIYLISRSAYIQNNLFMLILGAELELKYYYFFALIQISYSDKVQNENK